MLLNTASRVAARSSAAVRNRPGRRCFDAVSAMHAHEQPVRFTPEFVQLRELLNQEKTRLQSNVGLIASQNIVFPSVANVLQEIHMQSQPSEGRPGMKLYGGCEVMEKIELLCEQEALKAFRLNPHKWGADVQLLSCSSANISAAMGLLRDGDRLVSLEVSHGGHISHGNTVFSPLTRLFETRHYRIDETTGAVDYNALRDLVLEFRPKLIFTGASTQTRDTDYKVMRQIADLSGARLIADTSHTSGLIAKQQFSSPFEYCDVVTSSTYKGLRGPRSAVMFYRKEFEKRLQSAVFPGLQSGPRNMLIAGMCQMFREVQTDEYAHYTQQSVRNARRMAENLIRNGFDVFGGGTDSHQLMVNVGDAVNFEKKADAAGLILNRNMWPGDKTPYRPSGLRIGTNLTTVQGYMERDFDFLADILYRVRSAESAESIACDVQRFLADKNASLDMQSSNDVS